MSEATAAVPAEAHGAESHGAGHGHGASDHHGHAPGLQHHFDTPVQQFDAAKLGMWLFLAQELLFFSGLFVAYGIYRSWYPDAFSAASHQLDRIMGLANTIVLLFSSLTAALAVRSAQTNEQKKTSIYLVITILCACFFMVVKYFEYAHKFHAGLLPGYFFAPHADHLAALPHHLAEKGYSVTNLPGHTNVFFSIYFLMTGVHGLHVVIGIGVMIWILMRNMRGEFSNRYFTPVDLTALYWHLVDLVWIYLFPLLYLID